MLNNKQNIPYSLHDMYITDFDVITTNDEVGINKGILEFCFDNGVIETKPPYKQTDRMKIRIDGVDIDSCDVLLIYDDYADESESRTISGKRVRIECLANTNGMVNTNGPGTSSAAVLSSESLASR